SLALSGGTFEIAGTFTSAHNISLKSGGGTFQVDGSNVYTAASGVSVTGSGSFTKSGSGSLDLTAATTSYFGTTTVAAGTLSVTRPSNVTATTRHRVSLNAANYSVTAPLTLAAGATANISDHDLSLAAVTNAGPLNFASAAGVITLAGLSGAGTTTFSAG